MLLLGSEAFAAKAMIAYAAGGERAYKGVTESGAVVRCSSRRVREPCKTPISIFPRRTGEEAGGVPRRTGGRPEGRLTSGANP